MDLEQELTLHLCNFIDQPLALFSLPPDMLAQAGRLEAELERLETLGAVRVARAGGGIVDITALRPILALRPVAVASGGDRPPTTVRASFAAEAQKALDVLIDRLAEEPSAGPRHARLLEELGRLALELRNPDSLGKLNRWWLRAKPYFDGLEGVEGVMALAGRASAALGLWKV